MRYSLFILVILATNTFAAEGGFDVMQKNIKRSMRTRASIECAVRIKLAESRYAQQTREIDAGGAKETDNVMIMYWDAVKEPNASVPRKYLKPKLDFDKERFSAESVLQGSFGVSDDHEFVDYRKMAIEYTNNSLEDLQEVLSFPQWIEIEKLALQENQDLKKRQKMAVEAAQLSAAIVLRLNTLVEAVIAQWDALQLMRKMEDRQHEECFKQLAEAQGVLANNIAGNYVGLGKLSDKSKVALEDLSLERLRSAAHDLRTKIDQAKC